MRGPRTHWTTQGDTLCFLSRMPDPQTKVARVATRMIDPQFSTLMLLVSGTKVYSSGSHRRFRRYGVMKSPTLSQLPKKYTGTTVRDVSRYRDGKASRMKWRGK